MHGLKKKEDICMDLKIQVKPMNGLKTQDNYAWTQKDKAPREGLKNTEDVCIDSQRQDTYAWTQKDRRYMHGLKNTGNL